MVDPPQPVQRVEYSGGQPEAYPPLAAPSAEFDNAREQAQITVNNQGNETDRALNDTNDPDKILNDDRLPDISPAKSSQLMGDDSKDQQDLV